MKKQHSNFRKFWVHTVPLRLALSTSTSSVHRLSQRTLSLPKGVAGALALLFLLSSATLENSTCLNSVKKVFDQMKISTENSEVSYMNYTVTAKLHERDNKDKNIINSSTFEVISNKKNSRIYSKEMIVLRDEKNTFTILPQKKTIYWQNTFVKEKGADAYNDLRKMQDSVFKHAEKVDCKTVTGQAYTKMITVSLDKNMAAYMQMKKLTYCIDDKKNLLSKVEVEYLPNNNYENIVYVFNEQNYDYKKADMTIPVQNLVLENDKTLQKLYAGFKLIDTRKK